MRYIFFIFSFIFFSFKKVFSSKKYFSYKTFFPRKNIFSANNVYFVKNKYFFKKKIFFFHRSFATNEQPQFPLSTVTYIHQRFQDMKGFSIKTILLNKGTYMLFHSTNKIIFQRFSKIIVFQ